ncbi:MAG TPA: TonB-dependent receptor [Arenibacter sp.]|nr:TonB-dependent receptor [Arenibacter sp.]
MRVLLLCLCVLFSIRIKAQEVTGSIVGKLVDTEYNDEPLAFANIIITGTVKGTTTDLDGLYELTNLEPNTYNLSFSYLGYQTVELPNVQVVAGKVTTINVPMSTSEGVSLNEVIVTTVARKDSEVALLLDQKRAVEIREGIGAVQLGKIGVSDVAGAATKISGVGSSEASGDVFVRGLGDRYLSTTLNGLHIPSDDVEKKNIDLSLFTTGIVQNVSIGKTYSSKSTADQASGAIDISSRELSGNKELEIKISGGVNTNVARSGVWDNFRVSPNLKNATMGFYRPKGNLQENITQQGWNTERQQMPMDHSYSLVAGKRFTEKFAAFLTANHSRSHTFRQGVFRQYRSNFIDDTITDATTYRKSIVNTGLLDLIYNIDTKNKIKSTTFFVNQLNDVVFEGGRNGEASIFEETAPSEGLFQFIRDQNIKQTRLLVTQLLGTHQLSDKNTLDWAGGYNILNADEPNRIRNEVNFDPEGSFVQLGRNGGFQQRKSSQLIEDREFNGYVKDALQIVQGETRSFKIELGASYRNKKRDFSSEFVGVEEARTNVIHPPSLDGLGSIFQQENFDNGLLEYNLLGSNGNGERKDIYSGKLDSKSIFANFNVGIDKWNFDMGLRFQRDQILVHYDIGNLFPRTGSANLNYSNLYPSFNAKYAISELHALRVAVSRTITLPEFKEVAPFEYVSPTGQITRGNLDLEASNNINYDLKWEYFPSSGQLISLAAFYKDISNPINRVRDRGSAGVFSYFNSSKKAEVFGLEAETRLDIIKPMENDANNSLSAYGLNLALNATRMWHAQDLREIYDRDGNLVRSFRYKGITKTDLQGASDWILNASLNFTTAKENPFGASLSLNYASDKIFALGVPTDQANRDIFYDDAIIEKGFVVLDAVVSKSFGKHWDLRLTGKNLLNPEIKQTQLIRDSASGQENERTVLSYTNGANIHLGINYSF